ncbi:ferritin heavy chain A-like [Pangshura tecta]
MESQVCQNFHLDCEAVVNCMVKLELYASYVYLSMFFYFDCADVALRHVTQFLKKSYKLKEYAERFLSYLNELGKPEQDEWGNSLEALQLEKTVNQALLDLHKLAMEERSPCGSDFLESENLEEQVKAIKQLGDHLINLKHLGVPQTAWESTNLTSSPWGRAAELFTTLVFQHMAKLLKEQLYEEKEHAEMFLKYQNKGGGRCIVL